MEKKKQTLRFNFWNWTFGSVIVRIILIYFSQNLNFDIRPEVSTPVTSLRRLSEGYWLKQLSMSPYAGSMYHGSPLLLAVLGPLTVNEIAGLPSHVLCSLVSVVADVFSAILIRAIGKRLQLVLALSLKSLQLSGWFKESELLPSGDIAAIVYLWSPFTLVTCVGFNTTPIENLFIILSIYGACARVAPLAAFGWTIASHLSLYPTVLIVPVILLLGYGPDSPPRKLSQQRDTVTEKYKGSSDGNPEHTVIDQLPQPTFSWRPVLIFMLWTSIWTSYVLFLCAIAMKDHGGLSEMFIKSYGFILTVKDLSPNIGVLWYFFAEVFDFFRNFFLIVFHVNIIFMIFPLAIRLSHRPIFLSFAYVAISSMLKSYPSVGDSALYLSLLALFANELAEMDYSFFIFCGYVGVSLLSPVMHNLWIWRGTGNANFYFATAMAYACFQIILIVESVSAMLNHDRKIQKLCTQQNTVTKDRKIQ